MMSVRSSLSLSRVIGARSGFAHVETEILAETGAVLGHRGRALEAALADLAAAGEEEKEALLQAAADEVWAYFVQREMCGLLDHSAIISEMNIPHEVLNRMGMVKH